MYVGSNKHNKFSKGVSSPYMHVNKVLIQAVLALDS